MYTHTRAPEGACRVTLSCDKHFVLNRPRLSYGWKAGPKAAGSCSFWSMISLFPSLQLSGSLSRQRAHCVDLLLRRAGVRSRSPLTQQQPRQPAREGKGHWKSKPAKDGKTKVSLSKPYSDHPTRTCWVSSVDVRLYLVLMSVLIRFMPAITSVSCSVYRPPLRPYLSLATHCPFACCTTLPLRL